MQKLRRLNFFDKHVVKQEGSDVHPGIQRLSVSCACGAPDHLWLGSQDGELHRLDQQFSLQPPVRIFDRELTDITVVLEGQRLVALGCDAVASGATKYKIFDLRREGGIVTPNATSSGLAAPLVANRVFPQRVQEVRASCLAANSALSLVAIGVDSGVVYLFRSNDLGQDRPYPTVLGTEGDPPITSVHFLEQDQRIVLYVCSTESVCSWSVSVGNDQKQLSVDTAGGPEPHCSCVLPLINALLVARGDAIFAYDPDQGNMSAMQLDGDKLHMSQFKSYFISVTADGPGSFGVAMSPSPSSMPKQTITICLAYPHMRFIAYSNQFTDVTHVVVGMGSVFVISRGGADSNTVLFELREKDLSEQLDILVKKRMFEWAAETALRGGAAAEAAAEIYRQHGDALFEKRAYDQALAVYTKTVDLGLPLEPSYVVERYLDAQRIGHVAKYLKRLHEANLAEREHTALLLKCYTKLKDFSTLGSFLEMTPVSQYDPATAIEVLESAGYYGLAAEIAQKVDKQEDYVRISLEHFKSYTKITDFIGTLPKARASRILAEHGRVLMRNAPRETVNLVRAICGLRADGGPRTEPASGGPLPRVDELLPMFVDSQPQLELFLRSLLLAPGGCTLPPVEAESLYPTLLELMVRSHAALLNDAQLAAGAMSASKPGTAPQGSHDSEQQARRLSSEIMRLIRQYPSEGALASALMLCQTYGFTDGFFHAAERLGRYQLLMTWCFEQRDARRLLEVCKRCGSADQSLWVQALSFLAEDEGDHMEEISEVLKHVEESDLMPLLMVIETLQKNSSITVGDTRAYLQGQFGRLVESVETSRGKARQDRHEIMRMQQEITSLRTQAQVFSSTRCAQCGLSLEVPAVHFFCGHSYHSYCVQSDGGCPKCSAEALPKTSLKEKREAQARNPEEFFKYLRGGGGEVGLQAIGEWCKFGAFDAATPGAAGASDGR